MDRPACVQDIPVYLTLLVAEAHKLKSVEDMYALRRAFEAMRPEIIGLTRSCAGEVVLENALDGVAQYLLHRDPELKTAALETIDYLRLMLAQPPFR
jgi:hypothetical protein